MFSRIYFGSVFHRRLKPHNHSFKYKLFMLYIDLDELPMLFNRFWLWSINRSNIASFKAKNYLCDEQGDIKNAVKFEVQKQYNVNPMGPIRMLTHLSYFGYCFNPVTFYYCFNQKADKVDFIVAQINNTPWNERFCYVLDNRKNDTSDNTNTRSTIKSEFKKEFHVSPFLPMDMQYHWQLTEPNKKLNITMSNSQQGDKIFDVFLSLQAKPINSNNLAMALVKFPLMTLKVVLAIYWQSLKLWLKKTPFFVNPTTDNSRHVADKN